MPKFILESSDGFEATTLSRFEAVSLVDLFALSEIEWNVMSVGDDDNTIFGEDKAGRKMRLRKEHATYRTASFPFDGTR